MKKCKTTLVVLAAGFAAALAARICQITLFTDMTTGFIFHDAGLLGGFCYYLPLLLVFAAAFPAVLFDEKRGGVIAAQPGDIVDGKAAAIGFGMLLFGALAVYHGAVEMKAVTPSVFAMGVDFVLGGAIIIAAFATLYLKEFKPWLGFAYAAGACYFTARGVIFFIEHMAITSVPEYLIECLCDIALALFFMQLAKYLSGNAQKRTAAALCVIGVPAAVISLSSSLAVILCDFFAPETVSSRIVSTTYAAEYYYQSNHGKSAYLMAYSPWTILAAGVLAAITLCVLCTAKKQSADSAKPEDSEE
ncbi:MAG: hypothetical protein KIG62_07535 [Oscillospiraceae bacterium]|nr:hypothetical protein [Oscillospiraceae bacterium]